jgi:hypothetical protein
MKKIAIIQSGIVMLVLGLFLSIPITGYSQEQEVIDIQVSPSTLNLQNQGQVVTVHTEIAYSLVVAETVELNGVEIDHWKADNQGNFVAKFLMENIVELPLNIGGYNTLTLEGDKSDGSTFIGTDEVMVINVIPQGTGNKKTD